MAKIPYLPPNNVTLTQIHPVPTTKTIQQTQPDGSTIDIIVTSTNYNKKYDIYVDRHKIIGVGTYYDSEEGVIGRNVYIKDFGAPIIVTQSYTTIKSYMDNVNCDDLCNEL